MVDGSFMFLVGKAVIERYNRNKKPVYGSGMDLSKAFDLVGWVELFKILQEKNIAPVFLGIILFIYSNQYCDVRWNWSSSHRMAQTVSCQFPNLVQCLH
jgi:hypothetical protein